MLPEPKRSPDRQIQGKQRSLVLVLLFYKEFMRARQHTVDEVLLSTYITIINESSRGKDQHQIVFDLRVPCLV